MMPSFRVIYRAAAAASSTLLLLAAQTTQGCELKPEMAVVLRTVFEQFSGHTVE